MAVDSGMTVKSRYRPAGTGLGISDNVERIFPLSYLLRIKRHGTFGGHVSKLAEE